MGQSATRNGQVFEGVVPLATTYQINIPKTDQQGIFLATSLVALQALLSPPYSVDVINFSAGWFNGSGYEAFDREFDELLINTGVTFVKSSGNEGGPITSPGKALNVITVGNVNTSTGLADTDAPYNMQRFSSYTEAGYLPNKPDIAAPGTNMSTILGNNELYTNTGTSFAAPLVTGVIVQMMQATHG